MKLIKRLFHLLLTLFIIAGKGYGEGAKSKKLLDPMMPKTPKKEIAAEANQKPEIAVEALRLKAIAYDDDKSYCIINDQLLTVDDIIDDYIVHEITTEEVILIDKNKKIKKLVIY